MKMQLGDTASSSPGPLENAKQLMIGQLFGSTRKAGSE